MEPSDEEDPDKLNYTHSPQMFRHSIMLMFFTALHVLRHLHVHHKDGKDSGYLATSTSNFQNS